MIQREPDLCERSDVSLKWQPHCNGHEQSARTPAWLTLGDHLKEELDASTIENVTALLALYASKIVDVVGYSQAVRSCTLLWAGLG